jgi:hypothetical protein
VEEIGAAHAAVWENLQHLLDEVNCLRESGKGLEILTLQQAADRLRFRRESAASRSILRAA